MPALTPPEGWRRWWRLPLLLLGILTAFPLGLIAAMGPVDRATRLWSRLIAAVLGLRIRRVGPTPPTGGLLVSNHVGYLDILVLNRTVPGRFLAKAEIAGWTLFGWIARRGGSVFIDRDNARSSSGLLAPVVDALGRGCRVVLFPEGEVSSDGRALRVFRPMMFEACIAAGREVVPVALCYREPDDPRVWAWIDEASLWLHLWHRVLPCHHIAVEVRVGAPLRPLPGEDRKALADRARRAVEQLLSPPGSEPGGC
ncbi:MAG TPA: lysophospholipid acyltransferase family protein [Deferrisomatales bacterium]|nr:lysophospholipid acyltransferase family protein [Deferrisomatales bacterium]